MQRVEHDPVHGIAFFRAILAHLLGENADEPASHACIHVNTRSDDRTRAVKVELAYEFKCFGLGGATSSKDYK